MNNFRIWILSFIALTGAACGQRLEGTYVGPENFGYQGQYSGFGATNQSQATIQLNESGKSVSGTYVSGNLVGSIQSGKDSDQLKDVTLTVSSNQPLMSAYQNYATMRTACPGTYKGNLNVNNRNLVGTLINQESTSSQNQGAGCANTLIINAIRTNDN